MVVKRLRLENCPVGEFATLLNMVSAGKGNEALDRLRMSGTVDNLSRMGELHASLNRRLLMYLGVFRGKELVAVGAIKYYPQGVKIWVKEDSGIIVPAGILEYGLANIGNLAGGESALRLVSLPEYFELGNTAVLPDERGRGLHTLLHKERILILKQWHTHYGSEVPSSLLITATGTLEDQLAILNANLDLNAIRFVPRDRVPDEIWSRLGMVREVSSASAHLARKLGLREVGFAKSSGGPVFWTDDLRKLSM